MNQDGLVLGVLRGSAVHVPPFHLAREVGLSPADVDGCICGLRAAGFDIELRPGFGYKLLSSPDRLIADDLWARLTLGDPVHSITAFWREIIVLNETGSTNDVAAQLGRDGLPAAVAVFAEHQTSGRARFGRKWDSPAGLGLWMSMLLQPALPLGQWARLTTWAAVAAARAIESVARCSARIKWPNDIELSGRKAAGILAEVGRDGAGANFAVVGIGIDVNQEASDFPAELADHATSLREETGRTIDRAELASALLRELAATEGRLESAFHELVGEAAHRSTVLGHAIEARIGETVLRGVAEDLDEDGQLLLRTEHGISKLNAGEVSLRK
jgi:BirA family transcriptional regulator, biotin operon repressor / biotin---[acetyl-CoA-carboxylase] ligase